MTDLEHIHTRRGKYPTRPPPFGQPTWEEAKREKEEKLKKLRRERSPNTPLETTSTEAMDTEEAQEFGKEIVAKATQREYIRYQQRRQQAVENDFPKPGTIPVPQLEKPREKREARLQSVLSNFEVPNYEEISMYSGKPSIKSRSVPTTPQQDKEREVYGGARPRIPSTNKTAFQDYTSEVMKALNNPWNPRGRRPQHQLEPR